MSELSSLDDPTFRRELLIAASFLAGYGTSTRTSYATDLRLFAEWCRDNGLNLFEVQRSHLELFGRSMEARGLMASTVARRLSALASFYRYCEQEGNVDCSPATHVRRPRVDNESRTLGLDRTELSAFMVQAGIGTRREHALASLLALNGLRVSEALNADIDDLGLERGHHILRIIRKGGKSATVPLAPRTARAVRLYIGERTTGPIFLGTGGQRMDRHAADRAVKRIARRAGIPKKSPQLCRSLRYADLGVTGVVGGGAGPDFVGIVQPGRSVSLSPKPEKEESWVERPAG
ncbi:MAG: site-specific integrase [Acidimicrobiia bacterium]|nr:site-specific integrase [Acidimicrobiia bacterium]